MWKYRLVFSVTISSEQGTVTIRSIGIYNWLMPSIYVVAKVLKNYNKKHPHDNPIVQSYCKYLEGVE
jgi:hypothetical protein